ncbi:MAG: hypothetical protein HN707_03440 [Verrucomicrobia bacterium]|nr:hypothetical protein [Verrucomicrobiota bacterium]MBT3843348.1 hypothetical protein [Verrucomicrobiota bacterium]MBT6789784.1 hypothetical protein [Verrucomicrobiota bacterium]MBT7733939.1 hypothetical protein [Verrucomicrobiota bacterium]
MGDAIEQGVTETAEESGEELSDENKAALAELQEGLAEFDAGADEAASEIGNVAMFASAQGILGLIGSIMAFIALGKGNKATIGGVLILVAVVVSLWAGIFPSIGLSNVLHLIAGILAFVAAPAAAAAAVE